MSMKALLLSGGMDSFALAYREKPDILITIDYGQKPAEAEIHSAKKIAKVLNIRHEVISVDLSDIGSGDLSNTPALDIAPASDWWPYRNQALITIAAMHLISFKVDKLLIATVSSDSNLGDGTQKFISAISKLMSVQEGGMCIEAPALNQTTAELVRSSGIPYSLLAWAHSCHRSNIACGQCRGCAKHREVVEELEYAKA